LAEPISPSRIPTSDKGADDSKDFVEHLRTVHFALLAISLALVVIASSPSPVAIKRAKEQIRTISDAVTPRMWKDEWLIQTAYEQVNDVYDTTCRTRPEPFEFTVRGKKFAAIFENTNVGVIGPDGAAIDQKTPTEGKWASRFVVGHDG
jgi:hypothetical protein